jgi:hypothetical protein
MSPFPARDRQWLIHLVMLGTIWQSPFFYVVLIVLMWIISLIST